MTPDYALALTLNGLSLLARSTDDWILLGEVPVDSPDLGAELASLREKAGLEGRVPVAVLLPEDQIKFMRIEGLLEDRAAVEAVVGSATPYALTELSYDLAVAEGVSYLAIVALETLDEVEAFASHYDFEPVAYGADPSPALFPRVAKFEPLGEISLAELSPAKAASALPEAPLDLAQELPVFDEAPAPLVLQSPVVEDLPLEAEAEQPQAEAFEIAAAPAEDTLAFEPLAPVAALEEPQAPLLEETFAAPVDLAPVQEEPAAVVLPPVLSAPERPSAPLAAPVQIEAPEETPEAAAPEEPTFTRSTPILLAPEPLRAPKPILAAPAASAEPALAPQERAEPSFSRTAPEPSLTASRGLTAERPSLAADPRPQTLAAPARPSPAASAKAAALFGRKPQPVKAEPSLFASAPVEAAKPVLAATRTGIEAPILRGPQLSSQRNLAQFAAQMPSAEPAPFVEEDSPAPARGRPRYTALILTILLLVFLLAVALFSPAGKSVSAWLGETPGPRYDAPVQAAQMAQLAPSQTATGFGEAQRLPEATSAQSDASAAVAAAIAALPATAPQTSDSAPEAQASLAENESAPNAPTFSAPQPDHLALDTAPASEAPTLLRSRTNTPPPVVGALVPLDEAESFYSSTGVWTRASRPTIEPTPETSAHNTALAPETLAVEPMVPALETAGLIEALQPQAPPPAAGERLPRDPRGFVLATPEGTRMPDGMMIYLGKPVVVPPSRPESIQKSETAAAPSLPRPAARTAEGETTLAALEAQTDAIEAMFFVSPQARPDNLTAPSAQSLQENAAASTLVGYDGLRPRGRPQNSEAPAETAPAEVAAAPSAAFNGPRPAARPEDVASSALPDVDVTAALAAVVAEPSSNGAAPRRPAARPGNFSQTVAQQSAADLEAKKAEEAAEAQRLAEQENARQNAQRAAAVEQTAAQILANMPVPPAEVRERVTQEEADEADELVVPASPTGRVPQAVAQNATVANAINLRQINLIGVFGRANDRRAIVRLSNGRMQTVRVGDALDGGQVTAISDNVINYVKRGRTYALQVAGGA